MARWTYQQYSGGPRTVQAVGDWRDVIKILARKETPLWTLITHEETTDINPHSLEDTLSPPDLTNYHAQEVAAPAAVDTRRTTVQNWTQILYKTVQVTDTQEAVKQYGMVSESKYQKGKKLIELLRDIESFLVSDQGAQAPDYDHANTGRMGGVGAIITSHVDTLFTQARYDQMMGDIYAGGGSPTIAFMDRTRKAIVNSWTTAPTRYTSDIQRLEKEVLVYHSDIGPDVQMRYHWAMPQNVAGAPPVFLLLDPSLWVIKVLLPVKYTVVPNDGSGVRGYWKTELSWLGLAERGNGMFVETVSSSSSSA